MTDKQAIAALRAMPKVLKALAGAFRGTTNPIVEQAVKHAIQAIRDRQVLLADRRDP